MSEVITSKFVQRDQAGYIVGLDLYTNRKRVFRFVGRESALWANSRYQSRQSINPADIAARHLVEKL